MRTAILVLSPDGLALARRLRARWPEGRRSSARRASSGPAAGPCPTADGPRSDGLPPGTFATGEPGVFGWTGPLRRVFPAIWGGIDAIVAVMALGIVVRLAGPLAVDKRRDPAVVVVDDAGRFAISVLGGHGAGANELASEVADDPRRHSRSSPPRARPSGVPAVDRIGRDARLDDRAGREPDARRRRRRPPRAGRRLAGRRHPRLVAAVRPLARTISSGSRLGRACRRSGRRPCWSSATARVPDDLPPEPHDPGLSPADARGRDRLPPRDRRESDRRLGPTSVLDAHGLAWNSLAAVATVTLKVDEPGLLAFAAAAGAPARRLPPAQLADQPGHRDPQRAGPREDRHRRRRRARRLAGRGGRTPAGRQAERAGRHAGAGPQARTCGLTTRHTRRIRRGEGGPNPGAYTRPAARGRRSPRRRGRGTSDSTRRHRHSRAPRTRDARARRRSGPARAHTVHSRNHSPARRATRTTV